MPTPSTDNYTLGRGRLFFNPIDPSTGLYTIERALGNAPAVAYSAGVTLLDHFSSQAGFRAKDKKAVQEAAPNITFTLDELEENNFALSLYGTVEETAQISSSDEAVDIVNPIPGGTFSLGWQSVFGYRLAHGSVTGTFAVGETITGGTSSATATILRIVGGTQPYLVTDTPVGTFAVAETITGGTSTATASTTALIAEAAGDVVVREKAVPTNVLAPTTDYTVDAVAGRVTFTAATTADDATTYEAVFQASAATYTTVKALTNTEQEGLLRFVSDNPVGTQYELVAWRVQVMPDGETALIGDEWAQMSFSCDVLRDDIGHPDSPFMEIIVRT